MSFWISYTQFCPPLMGKNGCIPSPIPFYVSKTCLNLHPSIRLHIFHVHVNLGFLNSILPTSDGQDWMCPCPMAFLCLKFNFFLTCSTRLDVFCLSSHSMCTKGNLNTSEFWVELSWFGHGCSLRLDKFYLPCHTRYLKLGFNHTCKLWLDISSLSCNFTCCNFFTHVWTLRPNVFHLPCWSRYLELNIACTFCLRIDIFLLPCSCRCFKLNFFHTWILKLDIFRIPCHSGCPKFSFVHFCNLIRDVPRIFFSSRYLKLNFPQT